MFKEVHLFQLKPLISYVVNPTIEYIYLFQLKPLSLYFCDSNQIFIEFI